MNYESDGKRMPHQNEPENESRQRQAIEDRFHQNGHDSGSTFNFWTGLDLLSRRWGWLFLGALLGGAGMFWLGMQVVKPKYTANGQLLRFETPASKEFFKDMLMSGDTFAGLMRSPTLLRRVGETLNPPLPPEKMIKCIKVEPEVDSDMVQVHLAARTPQSAVDALNFYLQEAEKFTREHQKEQARGMAFDFLKSQVGQIDEDITVLANQFRGKTGFAPVANKLNQVGTNLAAINTDLNRPEQSSALIQIQMQRLDGAIADLNRLLVNYKPAHPLVQEKQSLVDDLQMQLEKARTNSSPAAWAAASATPLAGKSGDTFNPDADIIRTKLRSLEDARIQLVNRQREAELFATNAPGFARIFAPATLKTVQTNMRWVKISMVSAFGAVLGVFATLALVLVAELTGRRLQTTEDLRRVTKLPVLATLGDLEQMDEHERSQWAFRAWTMLQGRLSRSANHGLVCGITSSDKGEGRSTWIQMLAEAASLTGFRVLTISTRPSPTHAELAEGDPDENASFDPGIRDPGEFAASVNSSAAAPTSALTSNVLTTPAKVTEQLTGPNSQPMVHIPLPGWVWNLERRKQWRDALHHWRKIENLVIFVELPPASVAEAVLLGSNLPNLVWLADSGNADAAETRAQLETLRHARCNLVGAVLNRDSNKSIKSRFPRWVESAATLFLMGACLANGQQPAAAPAVVSPAQAAAVTASTTNTYFSVVNPSQRAAWQKRLTLGPGDVLNFGIYGQPELTRNEVPIPPDGMVTFLEAKQVSANGLTIDEFRAKLDEELGKYRRAPRSIVTPVSFRSKKYFMLGKVMTKGVYTLDRPMTVLEAIARAHGLENGLVDRNIIDIADMQRAFLVRNGKRIPLNFEKLFQDGDLSQNISIEPSDYIYFPATSLKEVYVVGEIRLPGQVNFTPQTTIMAAISARGGYTERAYKSKVLVVRGSINNPEAIIVNTHDILDGRAPDFPLKPRDIIYVNSRPFIKVEELADLAVTAFLQSLISSWVGVDVVKPIQ